MVTNITRSYHEDGKIISQTKHKTFYWDGTFTGLKRLEAWLSEANPRDLGITEICLGMEGGDCGLSVRYSNINGFRHARLSPGCYIYVEESEVHVIPRGGLQK